MKEVSMKKKFTIISVPFLLSAVSVWMVPGAFDPEGNLNAMGYAAGILFWAGLLGGGISYFVCFRKRHLRPGFLKAFSNKPAAAADGTFLISLAALIVLSHLAQSIQAAELLFTFLLLLSVYAHFLFNGKIFSEILAENKRGKGVTEQ